MRTREQCIADHIASAIFRGTRKRYSSLLADAQQEFQNMSTATSSNDLSKTLNQTSNNGGLQTDRPAFKPATDSTGMVVGSQVEVGPTKYVDANEFDGDRNGDTRSQAQQPVMPAQPAPRGETGTKGA
jgi:hypothetical protein